MKHLAWPRLLALCALSALPIAAHADLAALATYFLASISCPNTGAPICPCKLKALTAAAVTSTATHAVASRRSSIPWVQTGVGFLLTSGSVYMIDKLFATRYPWKKRAAVDSLAAAGASGLLYTAYRFATFGDEEAIEAQDDLCPIHSAEASGCTAAFEEL